MASDVIGMTGEQSAPKQFIAVTQGQLIGGQTAAGFAWSRRVIEHIESVTGVAMLLVTSTAGTMSQVGFIAGMDTAEQIDEVNATLAADTAYREMIDGGGDLVVTGSFDRVIAMKMA